MKKTITNVNSIKCLLALISLFFLSGCNETTLSNLTPQKVPTNPSGIYTITFKPNLQDASIVKSSVQVSLVIDGQSYRMSPASKERKVYEYNYRMPHNQTAAKYYCVTSYDYQYQGTMKRRKVKSDLYSLELINHYVISLDSYRGPVGSKIAVMGRGFNQSDVVYFNDERVDTQYISPNTLVFTVPSLPINREYNVRLSTHTSPIEMGMFTIDMSALTLNVENLEIEVSENAMLNISIDHRAPRGGLLINATTDIPHCLVMPEVFIPEGHKTVSIPIEGYNPGFGTLYFDAPGYEEVSIPVRVLPKI